MVSVAKIVTLSRSCSCHSHFPYLKVTIKSITRSCPCPVPSGLMPVSTRSPVTTLSDKDDVTLRNPARVISPCHMSRVSRCSRARRLVSDSLGAPGASRDPARASFLHRLGSRAVTPKLSRRQVLAELTLLTGVNCKNATWCCCSDNTDNASAYPGIVVTCLTAAHIFLLVTLMLGS